MRMRSVGVAVAVLGAVSCLGATSVSLVGCIPHPSQDFDDYNARTAQYRQVVDASSDSAPPEGSLKGLYYGACLSKLAVGRVDRVLRFYTEVEFVKDAVGSTGTLSLSLTPMKLSPGDGPPPTVSKSETIGTTYRIERQPTNAIGVYNGAIGTDSDGNGIPDVRVPKESNPISGRVIVIEETNLPGRFGPGRFCSQLIGHVIQPTDIQLEGAANTCLYVPVKEGDPTPALTNADFNAGCALE